MLIRIPAHRPEDLAAWDEWERLDASYAQVHSRRLRALARESMREIARFGAAGPAYVSVSWGKDSVALAHLAWCVSEAGGPRLGLVFVAVDPVRNPYGHLVRDEFLTRWPMQYDEQAGTASSPAPEDVDEVWDRLLDDLEERRGAVVYGIRADESAGRRRRIACGLSRGRTCAPLGRWTLHDVYAYCYAYDLPLHPVYAMCMGGRWPREVLRVDQVGGVEGAGTGRAEWEAAYLPAGIRRGRPR